MSKSAEELIGDHLLPEESDLKVWFVVQYKGIESVLESTSPRSVMLNDLPEAMDCFMDSIIDDLPNVIEDVSVKYARSRS